MVNDVLQEAEERMKKSLKAFDREMAKVRTGRASTALLEGVKVDYYGALTPLNQMASISVPESRLIVVKPWDVSVINDAEKAIQKANLGVNPSNDGKLIRISIPPLTEERRKEIVKNVSQTCEEYKVAVRNIRRDANENLKEFEKSGDITEDDSFKGQKRVQELTDEYIQKLDDLFAEKEKEILEV